MITRYLPYMILLAGLAFLAASRVSLIPFRSLTFYSIITLFFLMLSGAIFTIAQDSTSLEQTFLGRSISFTAAIVGVVVATDGQLAPRILRPVALIAVTTGLIAMILRTLQQADIIYPSLTQSFHEESFLLFASSITAYIFIKNCFLRLAIFSLTFLSATMSGKTTSLLLLVMFTIIILWTHLQFWLENVKSKRRKATALLAVIISAILVSTVAMLLSSFIVGHRLQARENDLRAIIYADRWHQFLSSPWLGTAFKGSPLYDHSSLPGHLLPSHNDHLDLLAFGGLLSFGLFLVFILKAGLSRFVVSAHLRPNRKGGLVIFFAFATTGYIITSLANPLLSNPRVSLPTMFILGAVAGTSMLRRNNGRASVTY